MKISIIVPVYNSEKYLIECIESILSQSHRNIELLLVDDESQDTSPEICDMYQTNDERVKVVHKKNGGTAEARNVGLQMATGDYVMFVDNDDFWNNPGALEEIVQQLNETKADVLMFNTMEYWENRKEYTCSSRQCDRNKIAFKDREDALEEIIKNGLLYRAVWAKVIRRDLIITNQLYFESGIRNEDTEWTAKLLLCAQCYDWYEKVFYVYRKGTGNAQTDVRVSEKEVSDLKDIITKYVNIGQNELSTNSRFISLFYSYLAYPFAVLMGQARLIKNRKYIKELKNMTFLLNYDLDPSVKQVRNVYKLFGYTLTTQLLKMYLMR
ncbi:glycosyltransferase family 2 protein [Merdimonas faecis]|uniref:glycosyltransferase family 2 protein n=1 Tax=Merdimonas faecis TaxID=1653435 RepID=UPI0022E4C55C|nr:glycosyltransferase [Merdimonas faecis]